MTPPDVQRQLDAAAAAVTAAQQSAANERANAATATAFAATANATAVHYRHVLHHMMAMKVTGGGAPAPVSHTFVATLCGDTVVELDHARARCERIHDPPDARHYAEHCAA